jgi:dihydrofolate synthase/folylpolyglutamate synthase
VKTFPESVRFLYGLEKFGMKFGLDGISTLLRSIDNPHRSFPCIHVAGTNGKGSTSSMLASIFTTAGYRTALFTSPHLISFTERIRIDGKPIPTKEVVRITNLLTRQIRRQRATFFEATTAMAFKYFADSKVDIAIIETGLGGRLDSTNVVIPLVSVITNVSMEHTEILGESIEKIAWEKGGIIKRNIPCVTGIQTAKPLRVLRKIARTRKAPLFVMPVERLKIRSSTLSGITVETEVGDRLYKNLRISLAGKHQAMNAALVLQTLDILKRQEKYIIKESQIRRGLNDIQQYSGLQARLSIVQRRPLIIADVAHNHDGVRRMVESLKDLGIRDVCLIFGVVRDKNYESMIASLKQITRYAILATPATDRARSLSDLVLEFERQDIKVVEAVSHVGKAVERALVLAAKKMPILITGSHFVVGEALSALRRRKNT